MKVFKFGGASIKDASSFKNVAAILNSYKAKEIVVIVSALGKTTNALEKITDAYFYRKGNAGELLNQLREQHLNILKELFPDPSHPVFIELNNTFVEIDWILEDDPTEKYDYLYDQIVSIGEMASTKMLAAYLNYKNIPTQWVDVRDCIATDNNYREGKVNWEITQKNIEERIPSLLKNQFVLTQGFLGGTSENFTTTLGREGSDYSASIFAYSLNAESVTIWKDVEGVLNADPRSFPKTIKIDQLSYHEAIEMTYYGATVIHPKTLKPLQNKNIPLLVKCFLAPEKEGTVITSDGDVSKLPPVLVLKQNQILISITPKDFSFIAEDNLSQIFNLFSAAGVKISMMQNSALSFSACADLNEKIPSLILSLKESFNVLVNENLNLLTIRHYTQKVLDENVDEKNVLLEQKSRHTIQLVMKPLFISFLE
jgi:aspartate kinase